MNIAVAADVATVRRAANRIGSRFQAWGRAWNSLTRRHWLVAAGIGMLLGFVYAMSIWLGNLQGRPPSTLLHMLGVAQTRWILLMTAVACTLTFALALLRDIGQRGAIRPRQVALAIVAVIAFCELVVDPIVVKLTWEIHRRLGWKLFFTDGVDWLTALTRILAISLDKVATAVTTTTLAAVYFFKISRTSDALAEAQLSLSQARRRALGEELRAMQAAVDPAFLFGTLGEVDRRIDGEPQAAQHLLDALIRHLRAALPANDAAIETLGEQAALLRTYFEIEAIRSGGRVQGAVEVPAALEARPFAPALIFPLVALAANTARSDRAIRIRVNASVEGGHLTVEVEEDASEAGPTIEQESTLASLRHRIAVLYGERAELSFAVRAPHGSTATITIDDPGIL